MPFEILDDEAPAAAAGGYEILDEETPGTLEGIANSFQRGNLAGQRAIEALQFKDEKPTMRQGRRAFTQAMEDPRYSFGLLDNPDKTESLLGPSARLGRMTGPARESNIATAGNIADLTQRMGAIPQSAAMQEWSKADNSNWWQVFARNPVEITANIFAESLPQASAGMAAGMAGGMAGGPVGAAAGAGTGSFVVEASNAFLDGAAQAGVDLADPEQVRAFFADEAKVKEARAFAMQRGFPVALFDALTAGVAGKFLKPALGKGVGRVAAASGAEAGVQMAGGAAGEAAAQVTSGQELSGKDIFAEAVGELVTAPGEVVSNLRTELRGFDVIEEGAGDRLKVAGSENAAPAIDAKELEAAMRGNQLKPKVEREAPKPKADASEIVMADLPEAARAQLTRRMEQGPATPESLPPPEKPGATGAASVDWNPTPEQQAAAFQQAASKGPVNVPTESLKVGDALTIDGEPLRVVEVTPEGEVVLQDGKRFGQQVLTDGTTIYAEDWQSALDETAGQLPEQATTKSEPISAPVVVEQKATEEAKPAATPTIKAGQKQGDLLGSGDIPFNLFSEQTQSGERIEDERRQREEAERAAAEFEAKNQPDLIESALDKLKIETPPGSLQAFGLLPETWNQLIEIVRKAYRAGKSIAAAIDEGIGWLRKNAKNFDETAIRAKLERVTAPSSEPGLAAQLEDIQQRLERIELNIIRTRRKGKAQTVRALLDERARLQEEFNRLRYGAEKEATAVEAAAPAPMPEFTQAQLDKVSSATLDGAPSAESFWTRVRKGLRYFATSTPEIAVTGDEAQNAAMFRRGVRLFGVETQNARRTAAREINNVLEPMKALGRDVTNPDAVNQFFKLGKRIRREEGRANPNEEKLAKWRAQQTKVREGLEKNPWYLFQQAVLWRDLWYRGKFLRTPSGGEITLPGGLEIDQVERAMQRNQQLIDANPHGDAVRESLKRHYALMGELQESLLKHGELIPDELRNPLYFPHHLLEKFTGSLERARPTTEKDFRAYLIAPVGSEKLIEAGYINALYKHVNDVTVHNARADVVEKYWRPYDKAAARQQELEEEAAERGETVHPDAWKRNLPPGMDLFTPSEEIPMRADYILNRGELAKALGVALPANGDLRNALVELGAEVRLTGDMIQKALVAGERPQWLLPMEIAEAIRKLVKRERDKGSEGIGRMVGHVLSKPLQWWKGNTLFNWYNYPRYEWGNTITDVIDKMLGADPGMARYLGRALKEVRDAARGQRTEEFDSAEREGVLQSITAAEVEELARLPEFEDFLTSKQWRMEKVRKFITWTARASAVRESTFRYAKFLADLERIRRGEQPVYAGAYWRDVQAARTPEAKAAEIALKTFGDYGNLSVVGNFLREHVIPFWSWQEINLKYHANLFRNLRDMLTLPVGERPQGARDAARAAALGTATFTARAAVGIALRLALMRLGVELWNQMGGAWAGLWDDDEDLEGQLSEADRRRFHLILGKDENGRVRVVYVPNALSDVAEWFGGNNFARLFTEWAKGDIPFGQFASDYGKQLPTDLVNKVVQGARPDVKFAYIATSGKDPFPDVTNQRDISRENLGWLLMQTVTDRDAATFLRQQLDKDFYAPEDLGDWLGRKLLQIRRRDAEQWAYYEIRDRAADWKEARTGKRNEGFDYQSPDQQVIRNFRKAIYRGDMENAVRFYHRLRDYGYTDKRFAASIRNSDPLSDLTKLERREFERGLTSYERELLARAERYYGRLAASKGREKTLFPSNERSTRRASEEQIRRAINAP